MDDLNSLKNKISFLIYESENTNESDENFLKNIKKRNNSILGFHP